MVVLGDYQLSSGMCGYPGPRYGGAWCSHQGCVVTPGLLEELCAANYCGRSICSLAVVA